MPHPAPTLDALPALVSVVDRDHRYGYVNAAYRTWFGVEPATLAGRHVREVLGDGAYQALLPRITAALAGLPQQFEAHVPYANGSRRVAAHYVPQSNDQGEVVSYVAIVVPAVGASGAQPAHLNDFVENVHVGLAWLDHEGRIVWCNRAMGTLAGASPDRLVGQRADALVDEPDARAWLCAPVSDGLTRPITLRPAPGRALEALCTVSDLVQDGQLVMRRFVLTDISDLRRESAMRAESQRLLLARQQQQAALARLGEAAAQATDLDAVLQDAVRTIAEVAGHRLVALAHWDGEAFTVRAHAGMGPATPGLRMPGATAPQALLCITTRRAVTTPDIAQEDRYVPSPDLLARGIRSGMSVPIVIGDRVWGVLGTHLDRTLSGEQDEPAFVQAVANIVGGVVQRHEHQQELVHQMRRAAVRERQQAAVARLGLQALRPGPLEELYRDAAASIATALGHEFAAVLQYDPAAGETVLLGQHGWGEAHLGGRTPATPDTQLGHTIRVGQPVVVQDLASDTRFRGHDRLRTAGIVCGMSVTVPGPGATPWGVISTHSRTPVPYALEDPHFLESVAHVLAGAIQRNQAEQRLREGHARLEALNALNGKLSDLGKRMASMLEVGQLTQAVTDHATEVAGAAFGAFFFNVHKPEGRAYMLYTLAGVPRERFASLPMPRATAIFGPTFEGKGTVRHDDVTKAPGFGQNAPHHGLPKGHLPVKSYLAVPVKGHDGRVIGGLFLGHPEAARFGDFEQHAVEVIAGMAAVAMENANLYEDVKRNEEAARAAAARAEEADRRKDEFLAMLGHELRNPLAPIQIALDLMAARAGPDLPREHAIMRRQVGHLTRLVDDLLDVSRITRGKIELQSADVPMADIVARAVETSSPLIEQKGHRLSVDLPRGLVVHGDGQRLAQVVSNLLTNAAKYTEPGGRIDLQARLDGSDVAVTVRDNGTGIEPELLPHVFETFVQGRQASDRATGGLGLGLAIVRNIVALHGGQVSAASEGRGRGSAFTVRLPSALRGGPAPEQAPRQAPRGDARGRVLVVDDNTDVAETTAKALHMLGYEVKVAADGPSALAIADGFQPDVALLDIGLPVMDGYELAARLRSQAKGPLALVAISGYGSQSDRARSEAAGIEAHLIKPVHLDALEACLARLRPPVAAAAAH